MDTQGIEKQVLSIPVKAENGLNRVYDLVELQGTIQCLDEEGKNILQGKTLGEMYSTKGGVPTLIIGNNKLEGEIRKLGKKIAIFEQRTKKSDSSTSENKEETYFAVKGIVQRKIIFNTRPKPILREAMDPSNIVKRSRK